MPIIRSDIATPTVFNNVDLAGINYITAQDPLFDTFIASLTVDGVKTSVDRGATWSGVFGSLQGGPWDALFELPLAVGPVSAGRLFAIPASAPSSIVHVSDNSGTTWLVKTLADSVAVFGRGARIVQTAGALKRVLIRRPQDHTGPLALRLQFSDDGGNTWSSLTFDGTGGLPSVPGEAGTGSGASFEQRSDGRLYLISNEGQGMRYTISNDEGVTWGAIVNILAQFPGSLWLGKTGKSAYHPGDDVVGFCIGKQFGGESDPIRFVGLDSTDSIAFSINILTTSLGVVDEINYLSAVPGIAGEWVISADMQNGDSLWIRIEDASGTPVVTTLKTNGIAVSGEGVLSNLTQFGTPPPP